MALTPEEVAADALERERKKLTKDLADAKADAAALRAKYEPTATPASGVTNVIPTWVWITISVLVFTVLALVFDWGATGTRHW